MWTKRRRRSVAVWSTLSVSFHICQCNRGAASSLFSGSYTFAKTIEYKAKHGLQSGSKEVTVIPPADYQERFVRALEGYFVACPGEESSSCLLIKYSLSLLPVMWQIDKWSKPLDDADVVTDPDSLPSVL